MTEWNKLLDDLEKDGPLDQGRTSTLRACIKRESELRQKKWLVSMTAYCLVGLGIMWAGGRAIREVHDMRLALLGVVGMIIGFEITVLIKLGYGNLFSLNWILQTIREVQLTVMEQARGTTNDENEGVES